MDQRINGLTEVVPNYACRVTVLYTFSQEAGVLLFYVKPLVRNYIILHV